jgi:phosphate transport system ATP-binding protein
MNAAVTLADVSVSFFGHTVLRDVNATFPARSISVLIGRSGSGKTTILRTINRLNEEIPGCVTTGQVTIDFGNGPQDIYPPATRTAENEMPLSELRRRAGMLFQTPNPFPVSVYQNLALPLQLVAGTPKEDLPGIIQGAFESVGLWNELKDRLKLPAEHLSGGQQQRLCLARLLALQPDVLLLDEPSASLDVHAAEEIEDLLVNLASRYTIIMVSHSLRQARRMANNILLCERGNIAGSVDAGENLTEKTLAELL